jgi:hypothetical protein
MVSPELRHDVPTLVLRSGELLRFHLALTARSVDVYLGRRAQRVLRRSDTRLVAWRAPSGRRDGLVMLDVRATGAGGSASYLVLLRVR